MRERRVRGKKGKNKIYTRLKRGGDRIEVFGRVSSSLGVTAVGLSISYLPLSFCIRWRKSIADRNLGQHNFSSNSAKRAYSTYLPYIVAVQIAETGQPNGFVEFVACRRFCVEPSEKDWIPRVMFISNFLVKVEAWNVVSACVSCAAILLQIKTTVN